MSGPPNGLCPEPSDNSDGEQQQGIKFMSKTACLSDRLNDYNLTDMFLYLYIIYTYHLDIFGVCLRLKMGCIDLF